MKRSSTVPRISIGIPTYNEQRYVGAALECFLGQTIQDLEIIVSDNASTDATVEIVRGYMARDPRIRLSQVEQNLGASRNFNRLVDLARAPYFRWASADDLSAPTAVERCLEVLEHDPTVILAYPKTILIDSEGRSITNYDDNLHLVNQSPSTRLRNYLDRVELCNAVYGVMRTAQLRRTGLLGTYPHSDLVLQAELAMGGKIWEVPERLFSRRFHALASSAMTIDELTHRYAPEKNRRFHFTTTRRFVEYLMAALRAPLSAMERLRVLAVLGQSVVRARNAYQREFTEYLLTRLPAEKEDSPAPTNRSLDSGA